MKLYILQEGTRSVTRRFSTYEQAVEFLFGRINYEQAQSRALKNSDFKLDRMRTLLTGLGNPQDQIPAVHIAGTKGKGSTAVMLAEILQSAGYRVGLFTSPHLSQFEERMRVNGAMPTPAESLELIEEVADVVSWMDRESDSPAVTFFEMTTAMAWLYYRRKQVDIVSLEVGLGGRLDSTNICRPEVCVITNISRDHMAILGDTLEKIAGEKAGIIKRGVPVVSGVTADGPRTVIEDVSRRQHASLWLRDREIFSTYTAVEQSLETGHISGFIDARTPVSDWRKIPIMLAGAHQGANAALALGAVDRLRERGWKIDDDGVAEGMRRVRWPARIEILRREPYVILDAAHNTASCQALLDTLSTHFNGRKKIFVFAVSKDKEFSALLSQIVPMADELILTQYQTNPRATPIDELTHIVRSLGSPRLHQANNPHDASRLASELAHRDDVICFTGSFFLAAEVRDLWLKNSLLSTGLAEPQCDEQRTVLTEPVLASDNARMM